jgi:two-component system chemotaxis response regulator CheY
MRNCAAGLAHPDAAMRNLLVDDNPVILQVLRAYLRQYGDCDLARNGAEGRDFFVRGLDDERPYDLICLDLQMPVLEGAELLTVIRQLEEERQVVKRAKVLVVTGNGDPTIVSALVAKGADGYLLKPIDAGRLKERLLSLELIGTDEEIHVRDVIDQLRKLCDADAIPSFHLEKAMRWISTSLERQALKSRGTNNKPK